MPQEGKPNKKIGIIGCGWLGLRLAEYLKDSYAIFATVRISEKKEKLSTLGFHVSTVNFSDMETADFTTFQEHLPEMDGLIITVPFPKRDDKELLIRRVQNLISFIGTFDRPLFLMSSTGIYPQTDGIFSEETVEDSGLEPKLRMVENTIGNYFPQANILRLGGLMGDDRFLFKYNVDPTNDVVNHVHYEDVCGIIGQMIETKSVAKLYNVVAPQHPTKLEIFNFQNQIAAPETDQIEPQQRIISTDLLVKELNYKYRHPDPRTFF